MSQYRKKPVIIEADQFAGSAQNATPIIDWVLAGGGVARWHEEIPERRAPNGELSQMLVLEYIAIDTLEGTERCQVHDWVIRGVKGEFYPCKPDIFEATYDHVDARQEPVTEETK